MDECVLVGEGMVELSRGSGAGWQLGHGGDTLNTAIHLARFGQQVAYLTALGDDPFSDQLRDAWQAEGIDPALTLTVPHARPGLYAIDTDADGERNFTYWRGESAARRLFTAPGIDEALDRASGARLLAFSLISLAILSDAGRAALLDLARTVRARGGDVAFDGNFRARLWDDVEHARVWRDRAIAVATIGLPTLEDEAAMGETGTAEYVAERWRKSGAREVVVKLGAQGCLIPDGTTVAPPTRLSPRDTSGAGDAFNAGYLDARLRGEPPAAAAALGHRIAGWVVMRSGAIPPSDVEAPYPG